MFAVDLDFAGTPEIGQSDAEMVAEWATEYARGCNVRIVRDAGQYLIVEIACESPEGLIAPITTYDGGNGEVDSLLDQIRRIP